MDFCSIGLFFSYVTSVVVREFSYAIAYFSAYFFVAVMPVVVEICTNAIAIKSA